MPITAKNELTRINAVWSLNRSVHCRQNVCPAPTCKAKQLISCVPDAVTHICGFPHAPAFSDENLSRARLSRVTYELQQKPDVMSRICRAGSQRVKYRNHFIYRVLSFCSHRHKTRRRPGYWSLASFDQVSPRCCGDHETIRRYSNVKS